MWEGLTTVLGIVGALGWGLYLGERRRCADLRALLTYGAPATGAPTGIFPPAPEPEDHASNALPNISEDNIERGASDLVAIAKANGVELSMDEARGQAREMLTSAYGYNSA